MDLTFLSQIIGFITALTVHEFSHAFIANRLGDPTAKYADRLSLNPLKHIDPFGTVLLPLILIISHAPFVFGWAKPVPVNPYNLKGKYGGTWVSLAGPAANFLIAIFIALVLRFLPDSITASWSNEFFRLFIFIASINVTFGLFNLIPVPPLDGSKILMDILPPSMNNVKEFLTRYGSILLMIFILFGGNLLFFGVMLIMSLLFNGIVIN
ncbi:MAG: site-2 protease family protein [Patescibacteria group bacterium]|nr:site-2 protease family protein [Patescibacteria group bacterium]